MEHVGRLVEQTDEHVNEQQLEKICGEPLF
jgi:hypothetical protein